MIYRGAADVASILGVQPDTLSQWRRRYPPSSWLPFPEPDGEITTKNPDVTVPGWSDEQIKKIEVWVKTKDQWKVTN